jgi:hypothetical protein
MPALLPSLACAALALLLPTSCAQPPYFTGAGDDASLAALNAARAQLSPNPLLQDVSWLYTAAWNGLVEGPTWSAWWTQNSYGFTLAAAPFLSEPLRTFVYNANQLWFTWIGNGVRVGLDDPNPAPDGCLCDAAQPSGAYYKQGDGNVPIHDWALEETLSGVIMQAELLLVDRSPARAAAFIPLFNRTLRLIEGRRDAATGLLYAGTSSNLLAPSYGAWLHANGTRTPAFLTGLCVSYVAALDRVIELELLAGFPALAAQHSAARAATLAALPQLLEPSGQYFVKWADPNGTLHGVLGQPRHGYIEAVVNHDAIALGVAERVRPGLSAAIMAALLSPAVPPNPATGGPGLRPHGLVLTQAGGLDDMELPDTSWLWQYGTWVNGGEWATCEARMMLAYARTGRAGDGYASYAAMAGFARIFRMDSPLVAWGSAVYQPSEPINTVLDMWGIPAALLRSAWDPVYAAGSLALTPHPPPGLTALAQHFPLLWGGKRIYPSFTGNASAGGGGIQRALLNGQPLPPGAVAGGTVTLSWEALSSGENFTLALEFPPASTAPLQPQQQQPQPQQQPLAALTQRASVGALRALLPEGMSLWLDAQALVGAVEDGAPVAQWRNGAPSATPDSHAVQGNATLRPIFRAQGMGGQPAVAFGAPAFLGGGLALGSESSVFAVVRDGGTTNACCSGIFFSSPGCNGLGTKVDDAAGGGGAAASAPSSVLMIDYSGSGDSGVDNLAGRQAVVSVVYNASGAFSFADGCLQSAEGTPVGAPGSSYQVGTRGAELGRYFNGSIAEVLVFPRALNTTELDTVHAYLHTKWPAQPLSVRSVCVCVRGGGGGAPYSPPSARTFYLLTHFLLLPHPHPF